MSSSSESHGTHDLNAPPDNLEAGAGDLVARLKPSAVVDHVPGLGVSACRAAGDDALAERLNQWIVRNNALKYEAAAQLAAVTAENARLRERIEQAYKAGFDFAMLTNSADADLAAENARLREALEKMVDLYEGEYDAGAPCIRPDWLVAVLSQEAQK